MAGYWEFPGGKIEAGETPEQCLARELAEELGIQTQIGACIGEHIHHYLENDLTIRLIAFEVVYLAGEFTLTDHDQICWLAPNQLHTLHWAAADIPLVHCYQNHCRTLDYYRQNALSYTQQTLCLSAQVIRSAFMTQLKPGGHILDLGCGSGRDSRCFIKAGFTVPAIDGCAEIAELAAVYIGQPVKVMTFAALDDERVFDGIWACASLLHCPESQLSRILAKVATALKPAAVAFLCFRWGEGETIHEYGQTHELELATTEGSQKGRRSRHCSTQPLPWGNLILQLRPSPVS